MITRTNDDHDDDDNLGAAITDSETTRPGDLQDNDGTSSSFEIDSIGLYVTFLSSITECCIMWSRKIDSLSSGDSTFYDVS